MTEDARPYRGRFAPSPTGDLHFGSLVAAVASYLEARTHDGAWLIRVEDIDPPREVPGSARKILEDLGKFGMRPDEEVLLQSSRMAEYDRVIQELIDRDDAYWCGCSRADIPDSGIYPGTCREGLPPGSKPRSVRLRTDSALVAIEDRVQGVIEEQVERAVGDFVIRRADGLPAYQLAVVVDDAFQDITHIVRGADLLASTPRQVVLQRKLKLGTPEYAHVPIVLGDECAKLSKRLKSDPVVTSGRAGALEAALRFLGQEPPSTSGLNALWDWALGNWNLSKVPRSREIRWANRARPVRPRL